MTGVQTCALPIWPLGRPALATVARLRFLRGTAFDPFGYARMRRVERALAKEYSQLVTELTASLDAGSYERAVAAASAVDLVRGYEEIKLAGIERYRERLAELGVNGSAPAMLEKANWILFAIMSGYDCPMLR